MKKQYLSYLAISAALFVGALELPALANVVPNSEISTWMNSPHVLSSVSIRTAPSDRGAYLVDSQGRSLYLLEATRECDSQCERAWPPLLVVSDNISATEDVNASAIGTIQRTDGSRQVTYKGIPLYFYARDMAPGDINGHGVEDAWGVWFLVSPDGTRLMSNSILE